MAAKAAGAGTAIKDALKQWVNFGLYIEQSDRR